MYINELDQKKINASYLSQLDERNIYNSGLFIQEAKNEKVVLIDNKGSTEEYVDLISCYAACNFGHNNEEINYFLKDLKSDICAAFIPKESAEFCEWMLDKLAVTDFEILFQVGGSFAVSTSISLAQKYKPGKVVYLNGAFHGLGLDSLSITVAQKDYALQKTNLLKSLESNFLCINANTDDFLAIDWNEVSSFIFEPIQGANGYIPIDPNWLKKVISHAKRHDVITIADEIQCGYYRHGHLSVSKHNQYDPDIYLFSKSLTNGIYPYSIVVYSNKLKKNLRDKIYLAHTFQTSALGCYAMKSVANYIDNNPIEQYCNELKLIFNLYKTKLKGISFISNIHVLESTLSFTVNNYKATEIVQKCFEQNILLFSGGIANNRIRIAPPLTIPGDILKHSLDKLLIVLNSLT